MSFCSQKNVFQKHRARAFEVLPAIISLEIELTDFGINLDHVMAFRKYHWLMGICSLLTVKYIQIGGHRASEHNVFSVKAK